MYIKTRHKNPFASMTIDRKIWDRTQVIDKVWEILLYLTCLFPFTMWIPVFNTATDTQPYAFVVSALVIGYYFLIDGYKKSNRLMSKKVCALFLICLLMGTLAIVAIPEYGIVRVAKQYVMYMSVIAIPYAASLVWKRNGGMNESLIKASIWIWFASGMIQKTINSNFGSRFVMRQSTSAIRGVVGLATEPSAYGFYCFFVLLLVLAFQKQRLLYAGLLLVQIFVLAESSVSVVYFGVYIAGYVINEILLHKRFAFLKAATVTIGGFCAVYYAYQKKLLPFRMQTLLGYIFHGQWDRLLRDGSIEERIGGITDSFSVFWQNYGLPDGFGHERYFSGVGILIAEGGIISIVLLFIIGKLIWQAYPKKYRFIFVFGFMITMLSAIPFSSPIVCFYLGYCAYMGQVKNADQKGVGNE